MVVTLLAGRQTLYLAVKSQVRKELLARGCFYKKQVRLVEKREESFFDFPM